jgi:hypothetical protein
MKHRVLVHNLNHAVLLVDVTSIGMPSEIDLPRGNYSLSSFPAPDPRRKYLTELGARNIALQGLQEALKKNGVGVLTITSP